jgi:hypothetical protein
VTLIEALKLFLLIYKVLSEAEGILPRGEQNEELAQAIEDERKAKTDQEKMDAIRKIKSAFSKRA